MRKGLSKVVVWLVVAVVVREATAAAAADNAHSGGLTANLAKWLTNRETPSKISTKVVQDVFPGMGFGLKAEERIPANETIMEVPASALISLKTASEGRLRPVVEDLVRNNCSSNSVLALHLLHERALGEESAFQPYIESLPKTFDLPLVWSMAELGELNGTQLLPKVIQQKQALQAEFAQIVLPTLQSLQHAELVKDFGVDIQGFLWASCCILSRAFIVQTDEGVNLPLLIPGVDLFNSGQPGSRLEIDNTKGVVSVVSDQDLEEGEQVYLFLGNEPNFGYMLTQGFSLVNNPEDFVELHVSSDPSDPFVETKRRILQYLDVAQRETFILKRQGKIPQDLFASLRVHMMKPSEFDNFRALESGKPLNLQNELQVFREVMLTCQKSLQAFPTSVKEDDELLLKPGGLERRAAYAILYRRGEKLVYIEAMHAISEMWNRFLFAGNSL
ncbi:rubisco LSMT substrate-binding domain-containing protein [Chloropicon primus]|uniref:Rubisco LSMT substrate-binding domain-containing protein n=1 Tax=Chloropicon primus TaxID=1764295 RepID=A0A5B8MLW1_9CHLO|nr:hypothetical protein A3770_05p37690 [Chloropicon primus]UPR00465.1 rubisco LSMT substrate-binding domain-containing protein [Chloropicon primus]|mmetsp:Transcript_4703/g.14042  ORF Transcript_4703/g.14042 Transcript_4703/m.14042 type:complete len:446 (-) Transcript_4703:29-1366(-)|eukprot:QDZ21251.1 hypothetical protein A3770_05p37690 [Chloropicon primus]